MSRALLIDDEPQMGALVEMCLDGTEVVVVRDVQAAIEEARRIAPAVVLLDLTLGSVDGLDLLPALRAEPSLREVPIVAFTVHGSREREAMDAGADGFIAKPFKAAHLRAVVGPYLERAQ